MTTGGSTRHAIDAIVAAGFRVCGVLALVDREAGGASSFGEMGIPYASIFRKSDFVGAPS